MEKFWGAVSITVMITIPALLFMWVAVWNPNSVDTTCQQKFGSGWKGRTALYSQNVCVNSRGEVKYP